MQPQIQDPFLGKVIDGRYEILARIGEGGMGVVYKAKQTSIDRVIAIKMLNPQMASDETWVNRFYNEAKACSRLQHPNTIRMFDFGRTQDGRLYMTMEFLDGLTLRQAQQQQSPMQAHRVLKILIQCCASLAEAHSIGIIHRDIKPDNVFLLNMAGSPDFVKLLDFSVAKLLQENDRMRTQAGVVFGTPQYMSPEQGRGLPLDARSDIYALGILAYEMLAGRVPFHDENPMNVLQMHLRGEVPPLPPTTPMEVQAIVRKALEKDPGRRYQSAGEMMQHCQQVFAQLQGGASIGAAGVPRTM
ncbi:MAG: serine/threonine protein kinase, partial [Myxococcales bacterium]|nr:serine/threonine protein kinase [Myxococcales bacterium]